MMPPLGKQASPWKNGYLLLRYKNNLILKLWENGREEGEAVFVFSLGNGVTLRWEWEGFSSSIDEDTCKFVSIFWDIISHYSLASLACKLLEGTSSLQDQLVIIAICIQDIN